jgi:hypothetical protein
LSKARDEKEFVAEVMHDVEALRGRHVDIDHKGPAACIDCGQDAYIRLAGTATGTEAFVCAHCFADRARTARAKTAGRKGGEPARASQSPPTRSVEGAGR